MGVDGMHEWSGGVPNLKKEYDMYVHLSLNEQS